jgi:hypothetical protein
MPNIQALQIIEAKCKELKVDPMDVYAYSMALEVKEHCEELCLKGYSYKSSLEEHLEMWRDGSGELNLFAQVSHALDGILEAEGKNEDTVPG